MKEWRNKGIKEANKEWILEEERLRRKRNKDVWLVQVDGKCNCWQWNDAHHKDDVCQKKRGGPITTSQRIVTGPCGLEIEDGMLSKTAFEAEVLGCIPILFSPWIAFHLLNSVCRSHIRYTSGHSREKMHCGDARLTEAVSSSKAGQMDKLDRWTETDRQTQLMLNQGNSWANGI